MRFDLHKGWGRCANALTYTKDGSRCANPWTCTKDGGRCANAGTFTTDGGGEQALCVCFLSVYFIDFYC